MAPVERDVTSDPRREVGADPEGSAEDIAQSLLKGMADELKTTPPRSSP